MAFPADDGVRRANGRLANLSAEELSVIRLLPTHLSFAEIGACTGLTAEAVRRRTIDVYRKLGVVSRADAVERILVLLSPDAAEGLASSRPYGALSGMTVEPDEQHLRAGLDGINESFFRMTAVRDAAGRLVDFEYVYCNQAALALLGRPREQVIGQRLLDLFPSHRETGLFEAFVHVVEAGKPLQYEFTFDENGVTGEFEVFVSRAGDGYVLAGNDITERKRRERELTTIVSLQGALASSS